MSKSNVQTISILSQIISFIDSNGPSSLNEVYRNISSTYSLYDKIMFLKKFGFLKYDSSEKFVVTKPIEDMLKFEKMYQN